MFKIIIYYLMILVNAMELKALNWLFPISKINMLIQYIFFKILIMAQIIENVIYCASVPDNSDQLFYTCKDTVNDRLLCHLFIVKNCSVSIFIFYFVKHNKLLIIK